MFLLFLVLHYRYVCVFNDYLNMFLTIRKFKSTIAELSPGEKVTAPSPRGKTATSASSSSTSTVDKKDPESSSDNSQLAGLLGQLVETLKGGE